MDNSTLLSKNHHMHMETDREFVMQMMLDFVKFLCSSITSCVVHPNYRSPLAGMEKSIVLAVFE